MQMWGDESTEELTIIDPRSPRRPWWRHRNGWAAGLSALGVLALVLVGFVALRPQGSPQTLDPGPTDGIVATGTPTATGTPSPTSEPTTVTASPSPSRPPSTTKSAKPKPTTTPPPKEKPPAVPPPAPSSCLPSYEGTNVSYDEVRAALAAAAAKHYWVGVQKPEGYTGDGSDVSTTKKLVNAIAWQESGWQSAIKACDGGLGVMQVMPATVDAVNLRFGTHYSIPLSLRENTELGANYLQWLIMYFGLYYFAQYNPDNPFDLYAKAPIGPGGMELELRDPVIAAYNVGRGAVENLHGTPSDPSDDTLDIPNWNYVNAVERFMDRDCPCDTVTGTPPQTP